jgi:transcriptional regulator with XRE-family HTH domain
VRESHQSPADEADTRRLTTINTRSRDSAKDPRATTATDRWIGLRIRRARVETGQSQSALADAIGMTSQQVQKYEKGLNRVSAGKLIDIARALSVSASSLLPSDADVQDDPFVAQLVLSVVALNSEGRRMLLELATRLAEVESLRRSDKRRA